jgi:hypothetical protein
LTLIANMTAVPAPRREQEPSFLWNDFELVSMADGKKVTLHYDEKSYSIGNVAALAKTNGSCNANSRH